MSDAPNDLRPLTILMCCAGRRIELIQAFRRAAAQLGLGLRVVATDTSPTAPALACCDVPILVPPIASADYIPTLLDAARRHEARLLIPTIDTDLLALAGARDAFAAAGYAALVADKPTVQVCRDKIETYEFLRERGIDTPQTYTPARLAAAAPHRYPYLMKPQFGSSSHDVHKIEDDADLAYFLRKVQDPIVQEFVSGIEHTLDVYVGLSGVVRCVVPRARWQVRGGEVAKGVTVRDLEVMNAGKRVVEALGPSVRGLVTLQCIVTDDRRIRFIEINPRFGGGAPLSIAAGADFPLWLLQECLGQTPPIALDDFRHGVLMSRYDWSVFSPLDGDLTPRLAPPLREFPEF